MLGAQARRDYYIDVLVEDVVAVVHALGYNKCVLAGHDWCEVLSLLDSTIAGDTCA